MLASPSRSACRFSLDCISLSDDGADPSFLSGVFYQIPNDCQVKFISTMRNRLTISFIGQNLRQAPSLCPGGQPVDAGK